MLKICLSYKPKINWTKDEIGNNFIKNKLLSIGIIAVHGCYGCEHLNELKYTHDFNTMAGIIL